ncbi:uncharacterized protein METZ01_LOCUS382196 [marine metagenome]|uniref:Uncharacterized protein n=1 Tax=marine metagenome TaxID=408172 RepID=A0A382U5T3_9ZZZZ
MSGGLKDSLGGLSASDRLGSVDDVFALHPEEAKQILEELAFLG